MKDVDRNAFWVPIARRIRHAFKANVKIRAQELAVQTQIAKL